MNKTTRYIIGVISILFAGFFVWYFSNIVAYVLISAVIAMIGHPLMRQLDRLHIGKVRLPRWVSAIVTMLAFMFVIFVFFRVLVPLVANQVSELNQLNVSEISENLSDPYNEIDEAVHNIPFEGSQEFSSKEYLSERILEVVNFNQVTDILNQITGTLGNLLLAVFSIIFITFFFLKDASLFDKGVLLLVPDKYEDKTFNALRKIRHLISRYFIGLLLQVLAVGTLITIGLTISGVNFPLALLIGILAGFINLIPYVGPWIGAALGITLVVAGNLGMDFYDEMLPLLVFIVLTFLITQLIDNFLFQPLIYSSSVKAHPLEIFLVILIAGSIAGIFAMILAIPAYTVLRVIAREFFYQFKLVRGLTKKMDEADK